MDFLWISFFVMSVDDEGWRFDLMNVGVNNYSTHLFWVSHDNGVWDVQLCFLPAWNSVSGFGKPQ